MSLAFAGVFLINVIVDIAAIIFLSLYDGNRFFIAIAIMAIVCVLIKFQYKKPFIISTMQMSINITYAAFMGFDLSQISIIGFGIIIAAWLVLYGISILGLRLKN